MVPIPRYRELGVKPVWGLAKQVPDLLEYFPDMKDSETPDRAFLWAILGTLRADA